MTDEDIMYFNQYIFNFYKKSDKNKVGLYWVLSNFSFYTDIKTTTEEVEQLLKKLGYKIENDNVYIEFISDKHCMIASGLGYLIWNYNFFEGEVEKW